MQELIDWGRRIVQAGLDHSHYGNISKRAGDKILISATHSMLDCLENDIVEVPLAGSSSLDEKASMELPMHRAIYRDTDAQVVIHGHTPYAVALSLMSEEDYIEENTCECRYVLGRIPIIDGAPASQELAENAAKALKDARGAIIRGHGPVVRGSDFKDAFVALASIEFTAQVKYLADLAKSHHGDTESTEEKMQPH